MDANYGFMRSSRLILKPIQTWSFEHGRIARRGSIIAGELARVANVPESTSILKHRV